MIRTIGTKLIETVTGPGTTNLYYNEYAGLSTDTKPTQNEITGSVFIEVDTGKVYFFEEIGQTWIEAGGSNG